MTAAALLAFREGLEAALLLGIVLSVLHRMQEADPAATESTGRTARWVWLGAVLAAVVSFAAGFGLFAMGIALEGQAEEVFEGLAMLLAAGVLTWMIFWTDRQGRTIQTELEDNVRQATLGGGRWALFSLAFLAVLREGVELALFLTAAAFTATAGATVAGGLIGLGLAVVAGWLLFSTSARLDVRTFFRVTSILLIVFAAGLVAHGVHELNEAGWIPAIVEHVWDLNPLLDEGSATGQVLKALFGYNGNPSLTEVVAYIGYWVVVLLALRRRRTRASPVLARA